MNIKDITIGMRVHFRGNRIIPPLDGTVLKLWYAYDEIEHDHDAVTLKPDTLPENWPYGSLDTFCPWTSALEKIGKRTQEDVEPRTTYLNTETRLFV